MSNIVEVSHLIKKYKNSDNPAVNDISFTVAPGRFFAFLGPNGAGKTTTISILNTTLAKTSGRVTISGFDLDQDQNAIRRSIGVIFQNPSLDLNLTAEENIRLHAVLYGLYPFRPGFQSMPLAYRDQVMRLASIIGIDKELFRSVRTFSGGMKRKLEIVRSLMHQPQVLFLDEPTSGLDPLSRRNLWSYLQDVRTQHNTTIFLTTHYLEEAESADSVCVINHGKIVAFGTPSQLKQSMVSEYLLIDAQPRQRLITELDAAGIGYTVENNLKIDLSKQSVQGVLGQIHTPLTFIKLHNPTLEDAYLDIVGQDEKL